MAKRANHICVIAAGLVLSVTLGSAGYGYAAEASDAGVEVSIADTGALIADGNENTLAQDASEGFEHAAVAFIARDGTISYADSFTDGPEDCATIQLLEDVSVSKGLAFGGSHHDADITLDLNGHTLRMESDKKGRCLEIGYRNHLTVTNGIVELACRQGGSGVLVESGSLTVAGDAAVTAFGDTMAIRSTGGAVFVSGEVSAEQAPAIVSEGFVDGAVKVMDGTVRSENGSAIECQADVDVEVTGGVVSGAAGIKMHEGSLAVTGGEIIGTTDAGISVCYPATATVSSDDAQVSGKPSVQIVDADAYGDDEAAFAITGGLFSDDAGNADGFTLTEGKELRSIEGSGWYALKDAEGRRKKADDFVCMPLVGFDGTQFYYFLTMDNVPMDGEGRHPMDFSVDYWVGDDMSSIESELVYARDCKKAAIVRLAPKDLLKKIHYRVYFAGTDKLVASFDLDLRSYLRTIGASNPSDPMIDLGSCGYAYAVLMNHYFDARNGKQVDVTGDEILRAVVEGTVVPQEYEAKVEGDPRSIAKTTYGLEYGDTANLRYYFTPAAGHKVSELAFSVDGMALKVGEELSHEATGAKVSARTLKDGRVLLMISGVKPADFARCFTVTAGTGSDVKTITSSALSNAYVNQSKDGIGDVCRAIYRYHKAVVAASGIIG